jgi:cbb3-type cytochrome oxidase subunit 1
LAMRAGGGALLVISFILFGYNIFATVIKRVPAEHPKPVAGVPTGAMPASTEPPSALAASQD